MTIRMAEAADLDDVGIIANGAFSPYVERIGRKPAPLLADYAGLIAAGNIWVVLEDSTVAGFCVLIAAPAHLLLDVVAVAAARQRRGLGRRLIAFAEHQALAIGVREIRLYTNQAMTENLELYPRLGYHEVARSTDSGYHRVHFAKRLDHA